MDKKIYSYAVLDNEKLSKTVHVSFEHGLSAQQAKEKLEEEGYNELSKEQVHWWQIMLNQFKSPFIYLLILAAVLAFALGERFDALFIFGFIFLNTFLGFYQEFRSEQALRLLRQYTKSMARVIRDGKQQLVPSGELVCGDVVVLETGDIISADVRLIEDADIVLNETVLTGESADVHKNGLVLKSEPEDIYGATNLAFTGTTVVSGEMRAVVVATGKNTAFGQIKKLTTETVKESIFTKGIAKFSKFILEMTVVTLVFVFIANVAIKGEKTNITELLIFSIALAVSVIPEALPVVTTLSLSRGALHLAKRKIIIKRLSAIEDLGSIEVLCTDKTGTITENNLKVFELLPTDGRNNLLLYANLAGAFDKESIEAFDIALKNALPQKAKLPYYKQLAEWPFDPVRKRNSVLVKGTDDVEILVVRGAPEEIMGISTNLSTQEIKFFNEWLIKQGQEGHRVLSVATRTIENETKTTHINTLEKDLNFEGCISFVDPIKQSTFPAVKRAKQLGVKIKIITGDSLEVALNVAKQIGIADTKKQVITATNFIQLPQDEQKKLLSDIAVFARTDPEQKHHIVKILQENFEVGFLGEGINDSPALKAAGVSLVVQGASDVAREASDIILLEKDLSVIIKGIEEGRKIFTNTIKYLKATLASNFGNFYAVAIGSLFIDFLPMLPLQLLLLNLLSDFPMISIATDSVDPTETKSPKKYDVKDVIFIATMLGIVSTVFDFMFFGFFYKISPGVLQTNWFIGSVLTELAFLFCIRTRKVFYKSSRPSKSVFWLSISACIVTILIPFTSLGEKVFRFVHPTFGHMTLIIGLVVTYFICSEIVKHLYYKTWKHSH